MPNQTQPCFGQDEFHRFIENESDEKEEARILAHIATCPQCQSTLEQLAGHEQVWNEVKDHLAEEKLGLPGEETRDAMEVGEQQRDLRKIKQLLGPSERPEMMGRLGGYEICGLIGRGSTGLVVKALDPRLNRYVAIKLLAPVYSNNGSSRRRFEREGRAIASVKDPNVIPVHTVGDYQGTPFIVMQYVPDGSLLQRIESKGPLETKEVVCVAMQVAKGLAAAHKRGIVHRDVKPANVLLESGVDCAMVTDFGLARVVDEATMTRSGTISGTPQYMSPEQARGDAVDPRTDLFSLGSVMYAACTGHSPFRAETVFGVIKRVCDSDPRPIRELNSEIPAWLEAFINKLHSKERDGRFDSADQVAELLRLELAHLESPTMVAKPKRDWWKAPPVKAAAITEASPAKNAGSESFQWATLVSTVLVTAALTLGALAWSGLVDFGFTDKGDGAFVSTFASAPPNLTPPTLFELKQENEKLPRFENTCQTTIDVKDGGRLFLRTNLGAIDVELHDKPVVEMTLVHTVAAKDEETAQRIFKALKLDYDVNHSAASDAELKKGRDAAIIASFPVQKLTDEEIQASTDLEDLKEQILIRNNSHFRNAEFKIRVPKDFNLDMSTSAGPINTMDIGGMAKLHSMGGMISTWNVSGKADLKTMGGAISTMNVGDSATMRTMGGAIKAGDVLGDFMGDTKGGQIAVDHVAGKVQASTMGGRIRIGEAMGTVKANAAGGAIQIFKANDAVDANAPAGSIKINFVGQPQEDSSLVAGAGSIRIGYVKELNLDLSAVCGNGKVSAPFMEKKAKVLQHEMNAGGHELAAKTGTGSIRFAEVSVEEIEEELKELKAENQGQAVFDRGYQLHMAGKIDEAIVLHKQAAKFERLQGIATYNLGCAWSLKGETDKAFEALNQAITFGFNDPGQFEGDEDLDSLRSDPRFKKLMERMGHGKQDANEKAADEKGLDFDINSNASGFFASVNQVGQTSTESLEAVETLNELQTEIKKQDNCGSCKSSCDKDQ